MWEEFKAWLAKPYSADMSALQWGAFLGLIIVIMIFWNLVLRQMKAIAE